MAMMAMAGMMLASCMGDSYADPDMVETIPAPPYGNNLLKEKNVVTIAQLKSDYKTTITGGGYKLIDKPMMIKGYITGNDISGNLYQQVALQDATGAILVDINGGGLYGYLPVGQEILIDLNGLYIGSKGKQKAYQRGGKHQGNGAGMHRATGCQKLQAALGIPLSENA